MNKDRVSGLNPGSADLILVNSPMRDYGLEPKATYEVLPPLGLGYIASHVKNHGYNVGVLDAEHHGLSVEEIAETLARIDPRFAGINVLTPTKQPALKIASRVKPETTLILGGAHATALPGRTLEEFQQVHYNTVLIRGEAESVVPRLLDRSQNTALFLPEHTKMQGGAESTPPHLDELVLDRRYLVNDPSVNRHTGETEARIITSRGCPYRCTFCAGARGSASASPVRFRSPRNISSEIQGLAAGDCGSIRFVDDLFLANERRARAVLEEMPPNISWRATGRANILVRFPNSFLSFLKERGAEEIAMGIESGSERLRERANKGVTKNEIRSSVDKLRKLGIKTKGYFIIGFPTEEREETLATLGMARNLTEDFFPDFRASVFMFRPYPGTLEWSLLRGQGYTEDQLLVMHSEVEGKRAKHGVVVATQFGEVDPSELQQMLARYHAWQEDLLS